MREKIELTIQDSADRERVDQILDKINEVGYDNLSEDEKKVLKEASYLISQEEERKN